MNMNKREIKKKIKAADKKAGIRIGWRELGDIADMVIVAGGFHELSVEVKEFGKLKQYIGTKTVQAAPALRIESDGNVRVELLADKPVTMPTDTVDMGYRVIYPDGYESFCPLDAFEEAYRPTDGMNFGLAIEAAKKGKKIARKGWNGKGQYVEIGTDFAYRTTDDQGVLVAHEDIGTQALVFVGTRGRQVGWLASQADMLADDWYIVE